MNLRSRLLQRTKEPLIFYDIECESVTSILCAINPFYYRKNKIIISVLVSVNICICAITLGFLLSKAQAKAKAKVNLSLASDLLDFISYC